MINWFKLYFICIIYDKYTSNTEYHNNTTTIQSVSRKSILFKGMKGHKEKELIRLSFWFKTSKRGGHGLKSYLIYCESQGSN